MRIDFVIPEMGTGGAEAVVSMLARHHRAAGHEVVVHSSGGWRMPELQAQGIELVEVPLRGRSPWRLLRSAGRMRRADLRKADVVHAHNAKAAVAARLALGRSAGAPRLLVTAHGFLAPDLARAARALSWAADHVVAVSDEAADRLREHGLADDRLTVVQNAVEPPTVRDRYEARRRLRLDRHQRVVLCLARMTVQKRHDLLVRAWQGWSDAPLLLVAGDGPTRPDVEALVASCHVGDRVRFLGDRQDADWLLAAADVLALPSVMEGLPISVLEAFSLRVPVVASAVGGLVPLGPDVLDLVPADAGPTDWRDALSGALADTAHRARRTEAAHRLVTERYAPYHMISSYEAVFAREITEARRGT